MRPWMLAMVLAVSVACADERQEGIRKAFAENKDAVVLVSYRVHASDDPASPVQEQRIAGVLLDAKGLVLVSGLLFPEQVPASRYDQFRVALPGEAKAQAAAKYLGHGKIPQVAFLRITEPKKLAKASFLTFQEAELQLADEVLMIAPTTDPDKPLFHVTMCNQTLEGGGLHAWKTAATVYVGCPVFTLDGKAIGVVSGSNPADPQQNFVLSAKDFLPSVAEPPTAPQASASSTPSRSQTGWLGFRLQTVDSSDVAEDFGLPATSGGAIVTTVVGDDSPAARAGLQVGDVILSLRGTEIKRAAGPQMLSSLLALLNQVTPGQELPVVIWRDGKKQEVVLKAVAPPLSAVQAPRQAYPAFGFVVREMVWEDRYGMRLAKDARGVVCLEVAAATWATDAGLAPNDVIQRVDEEAIGDLEAFRKAFTGIEKRRPAQVFLTVLRGGRDTLTLKLVPHW